MPKYFLALYAPEPTSPPPAEMIKQISDMFEAYTKSLRKIGAYVEGDGFQGSNTAQTVRAKDGKPTTARGTATPGAKEQLQGFYTIQAKDDKHAAELASGCPTVQLGTVEVRPIIVY